MPAAPSSDPLARFDYQGFQDRFRGPVEAIRAAQAAYLPFLAGAPGTILDLGCGRGEFLDLAREKGLSARGVDRDPAAVAACTAQGLKAEAGDGLDLLAGLADASLGAVVAIQLIEHLELEDLCRLVALAARKLAPAGTLLLETPNPYNEDARRHFWLDPTHVRPVHPELAQFLAESAGFPLAEIHYPGEEAWLAERERRRRRTWWDRLRGRRLAARPVPSAEVPRRPLTLAEGILFPDYALLARQKGAVNS